MCSVFDYLEATKPYLKDRWLVDVYPNEILKRWPYQRIKKYHCVRPECGEPLTKEDMVLQGNVIPHAMHEWCFADLTSGVTDACFMCGDWLEDQKLEAQKREPNRIFHRLHTGAHYCMEYFSVISCKAFGADMRFLLDEKGLRSPDYQISKKHGTHDRLQRRSTKIVVSR